MDTEKDLNTENTNTPVAETTAETAEKKPEQPAAEKTPEQLLQEEVDRLKAELAAEKDQNLRIRAEYDNYRKRTSREMGEITVNVRSETVKELLPVADNIERALATAEGSEADLRKGISMVQQQIQNVFTKLHIEAIDEENVPFDPQSHNAVVHVEDDTIGENTVVQVLQKGYKLGTKVLRYAMVKVAN